MTGLPAPTLWSAKPAPLTATFHIPTRPRPSSPMNRGRLHTGKEGSGTLGGKAGRSRDATPHTWYWYCFSIFCHHLAAVTFSGRFVDVSPLPSCRLHLSSFHFSTTPPEHSIITTIESRLACGVSAFTASQVAGGMCMPLGDSLDTAGSAETAAMLLTGGFVEMAWTAWCYLGPPCRRPPCRVLQQVQAQAQGMT